MVADELKLGIEKTSLRGKGHILRRHSSYDTVSYEDHIIISKAF